ncbi:MAG: hypothetical protein COW04_11315 [Deltaproteobacteria bacterium CG12_big_fil_rev_8_21_14_0_65_43_10]|nr:MAG: hypothetical protein AUK23_10390 [Deltaproteobacteria bacterium CG2_30_43_15]PIQ44734.1 MAG: hypothetical protein COW04_11315 [Deltaproteobacteria bacterium CG12_big_fil_rev_8_21_14_0_65_43_10]PIU86075.1 MAG: DUF2892 domain-containing protein [Deltaproteobacteria bacterium CG06_land_8_20_14_3_00_44_19]PIX23578.1 MAG: DUF2892 domain-containing protein [Deltaproteobacteria bacterium CG_4_8_14_3_um_filter_43_13]PIZ19780.1 MAG: DUF2892 domain-containing protein [Deltaproteobacteria bacteriu
MKKNMGMVDRVVRLVLAIAVLILYLTGVISGLVALILGVFALIFVVTSLIGSCPLYSFFKFSTRKE